MVPRTKEGVLQCCQYIDTPQVVHNPSLGILMIPIKFVHNRKVWNLEDSHDQVVSQLLCVMYMQHVNYGDKQQND